jgi:signal transduction histidine kinase
VSAESWTVVVIDDNREDRDDVRRMLLTGSGRRYRFVEAETCAAGVLACRERADVVILDYNLPDGTAFDVLEGLRTEADFVPWPVVVLTGGAPEAGRDLVRAGAQDFFQKSWMDPERLTHAVENAVERFRIERELREREDFERYLIGIVSHDLRGPLSTILLATQAALRWSHDERTARLIGRIHTAAERATRMIRDLLDFTQSRLGGGIPVEKKVEDLEPICRAVLEEVWAAHPLRDVRFVQESHPRGEWDADRVMQALYNLVSNAVHYSPEGSTVTVRARGEGGQAVIQVHNWGDPIPPESRSVLFQPLRRCARAPENARRSVGLGLYIVSQIARAHDGTIDVESAAETGTTFTLRLPALPPA